jgi:hypothetical protein
MAPRLRTENTLKLHNTELICDRNGKMTSKGIALSVTETIVQENLFFWEGFELLKSFE